MKLYDPYSAEGLPADVQALLDAPEPEPAPRFDAHLESVPSAAAGAGAGAVAAPKLNRWDIQTHVYRKTAAAEASFLAGLFKSSAKAVTAGVVQEAKFYRIDRTEAHRVEIGVAVRMILAATSFNVKAELSVPNLVAAAQVEQADTRVAMHVVGSSISVGDLIPTPTTINVENHQQFLTAFAEIRKRVFAQENERHFVPEVLGMEETGAAPA